MANDPESSSSLDPNDPADARILDLKAKIESDPGWPAKKAEIERDNFIVPFSSTGGNSGAPVDKDDVNAALKATAPTSGESMDFNQARTKVGEVLGVIPGTVEFDGALQTFAEWYDHASTQSGFR
jgi:hypothetical protein